MQNSLLIARDFTAALNGKIVIEPANQKAFPGQIVITADQVVLYTKADNVFDMPLGMLDSVVPKLPPSPRWMEAIYPTEVR